MKVLLLILLVGAPSEFTFGDSTAEFKLQSVSNLEPTPLTVNIGSRFYPVTMSGASESAAFYCRANPDNGTTDQRTCWYGEITNEQQDTEAGIFKVIHQGSGDAGYIACFSDGPAWETASFYNGSRGFISTFQTISGAIGSFANSTQFQAVSGWDGTGGSNAVPNYGVFYSVLSLGQSFAVRLQDPEQPGFGWGNPEFSIREYALDRYRYRVYNNGQLTLESTAATEGSPLQAAPITEWRGSYYSGSAADKDIQWQPSMDGSGNPYLLLQMGTNGAEATAATFYHDGDVDFVGDQTRYAEGYIDAGSQTVGLAAAGQNVWVEIDGCTSGDLNGWTHSACDFTAGTGTAGKYLVTYTMSYSGGNAKIQETGISIDDAIQNGCRTERQLAAGGDVGDVTGMCILTITATDIVKPEMRGTDATTVDVVVSNLSVVIHKL